MGFTEQSQAEAATSQSIVFQSAKLPLSPLFLQETLPSSSPQRNQRIVFQSVELPLSPLPDQTPSPPHTSKLPSPLLPSIQVPSFCFNRKRSPPPKPLLDIEEVRAFIRSKLGPPKEGSIHSAGRRVSSGVFGIGTMGSAGSDGGYVHLSSPQANEQKGQISSHPSTFYHHHHQQDHAQNGHVLHDRKDQSDESHHHHPEHIQNGCTQHDQSDESHHHHPEHVQNGCTQHDHGIQYGDHGLQDNDGPPQYENEGSYPLLDIDDVRETIDSFLHYTGLRRHPHTSWLNKMPWHVPRAPFLAKGLEWPPDSFPSEEARRTYYRKARKRKPFLLGSPPLWTVTALNLAFIQLLMYNPLQKFFNFLRRLP